MIYGHLEKWMDSDSLESHSIAYHAEMSIKRYYSAYETHVEGKAYKQFIDKMSFLNDDFNDKMSHFFAALERYTLNNKKIHERVVTLKRFNEISHLFQHRNFMETKVE